MSPPSLTSPSPFSLSLSLSFQAARAWATAAGPALESAAIRLCVANKADTLGLHTDAGPPPPAWRAPAAAWATDAGFEWVDAAVGAAPPVEAALAAAVGESVGLARVREVLEAHMWPGLERKAAAAAGAGGGRGRPVGGGGARLIPSPSSSSEGDDDDNARDAGNGDVDVRAPVDDDDDDEDDDAGAASFEALLADAVAARDRIRGLPDDERRAAAAAMASRLMAALEEGE